MSSTFGKNVSLTISGESHGKAITATLSGISPGAFFDEKLMSDFLMRRKGDPEISTPRREPDRYEILSGIYNGRTDGSPVTVTIYNDDAHSPDYEKLRNIARPGHADYTAYSKYLGYNMQEGGGSLSGRVTSGLVAAGSIAVSVLKSKGIEIGCHIFSCGEIYDRGFDNAENDILKLRSSLFPVLDDASAEKMKEKIKATMSDGNSIGGTAECIITGIPAGIGEPFFDSVESLISHMIFSIPSIKGIEFGLGFGFAYICGSSANDSFRTDGQKIFTVQNNNGGINGGITNGMPIIFRCAVKPTPSVSIKQQTVDYVKMENRDIEIAGRHDPAIISRIPVIIESAAAIVICDLLERRYGETYFSEAAVNH